MTSKPQLLSVQSGFPEGFSRGALFGPAPLVLGELLANYKAVSDGVVASLKPQDFIEQILVRDVVDLFWEGQRWRRAITSLVSRAATENLEGELIIQLGDEKGSVLFDKYLQGDPGAVEEAQKALSAAGLSMDDMQAKALCDHLEDVDRINRLIMGAEARRSAALRELERYRANFAQAPRRKSDEAVDAEFEDVPLQPAAGKLPA
jgi:ribosomal protein L12E/L44/L45/RPP1/RPP2